ncbi:hypothetical protein F4604DRAFT_1925579 [Suillus subluteus]|nr:hypothetical protein F4604DRAFT_1925579 [Suillus subluteus]
MAASHCKQTIFEEYLTPIVVKSHPQSTISNSLSSHEAEAYCCPIRIRDIVLAPNFPPTSVAPDINACTASLPAATFSKILQSPNIEGHTALYWAIVNNRPEAVFALYNIFPPRASSSYAYFCDARLACMTTGDHVLFKKLNLAYGPAPAKYEHLKDSLGCPSDDIQVHACDEPENRFDVVLRIHMFQKRLRAAQCMYYEFVAGGV